MADDLYEAWYQAKLWQLLPGVYRAQDAGVAGVPGGLQELLNRIGSQFAVLRRSIDRMWENQSIETCDDWVIPYIGDLLATRLGNVRRASAKLGDLMVHAADSGLQSFRQLRVHVRHTFDERLELGFYAL